MKLFEEKGFWDYLGAIISWSCAVHCLLMPFVIVFLPIVGLSFLADETTEWIIIGISAMVGLISFLPAYFGQHRKFRVLLIFIAGLSLILFSHSVIGEESFLKFPFIIFGAIFITFAHLLNRRLCNLCRVCKTQLADKFCENTI